MRKWGWRGGGVVVGACAAAGLGAAGQWWGGLAGAALIAVGGFAAPEMSDWLKDRRVRAAEQARADQAARAALDTASDPAVVQPAVRQVGGAALWLRPDKRVVNFIDRPELDALQGWCAGDDAPPVMLLTGAGGVGKTRLALRLAEELQAQGWLCRVVRTNGEADVVAAARLLDGGSLLLIVDYAETRPRLAGLLAAAAGDDGERLRVLLVARGVGEWWAQLEASSDYRVRTLVAAAERISVGPLTGEAAGSAELVRAAVPEFARAVGIAVPGPVQVAVPDERVPILVLHAAALLAVLDSQDREQLGPVRVVADEQVLTGLLAREKMFWLGSARTAGLSGPGGVDSVTAAQAVAVACLITVGDESEAAQALRRVPRLADASSGSLLKIADWLRQLYPVEGPLPGTVEGPLPGTKVRWWGSLQPDLLAERHVVSVLTDAPSLATMCLRNLTSVQAQEALTVLARTCAHHPQAPGIIETALRSDLPGLAIPAVEVAVQTAGRLGGILARVLSDVDAPLEILVQIEEAIPYPTVALAEADAILAGRIDTMLPAYTNIDMTLLADADRAELARRRDLLGTLLSQAGRPNQALPVTQAAVAAYRELAAADPRYRPDLVDSLSNLGVLFCELDRPAEAVPVTQETVAAYRELVGTNRDQYLPDLARSLDNLGALMCELRRPAEALPVSQEALEIRRGLAATSPDEYRPGLADSLDNLGAVFCELGRAAEALPVSQEALEIRRELAHANPDQYRPDLARSLDNVRVVFCELGRAAEALPVSQEALEIWRELAHANPYQYRPDFARSLENLGVLLCELGRAAEALPVLQEALELCRGLAATSPDQYRPDLARSQSNLGALLCELDRPAEAVPVTQEAVAAYRELAAADPGEYCPNLGRSLSYLGAAYSAILSVLFATLDRPADALPVAQEAVATYRELAATNHDRYRSDLARSLFNLGASLSKLGQAEALPVAEEAVAAYRELAAAYPNLYRPALANSLHELEMLNSELGRNVEALRLIHAIL